MVSFSQVFGVLCLAQAATAFTTPVPGMSRTTPLYATIETEGENLTTKGLLKRDRYVATNRFAVRKGKGAKFEARWANRKSRLSELQGFKYFHLSEYETQNTTYTSRTVVNLRAIHPFETDLTLPLC